MGINEIKAEIQTYVTPIAEEVAPKAMELSPERGPLERARFDASEGNVSFAAAHLLLSELSDPTQMVNIIVAALENNSQRAQAILESLPNPSEQTVKEYGERIADNNRKIEKLRKLISQS